MGRSLTKRNQRSSHTEHHKNYYKPDFRRINMSGNNSQKSYSYRYTTTNDKLPQGKSIFDIGVENGVPNLLKFPSWSLQGKPNEIVVPLQGFDAKTMEITCSSKGVTTICATKDILQSTARGQRKITSILEETIELPNYLVDQKMLTEVESLVENNLLVISFPMEKPKVQQESNTKPVKINIKVQQSDSE